LNTKDEVLRACPFFFQTANYLTWNCAVVVSTANFWASSCSSGFDKSWDLKRSGLEAGLFRFDLTNSDLVQARS